jgi:hypothetical protein
MACISNMRITQATHHWHRLAWQVILTAREDPQPDAVIARQCSVSKDKVSTQTVPQQLLPRWCC